MSNNEEANLWSGELEKNKKLQAGSLLLAEPFMPDENFSRTVVLICEHSPENGTVGLIINKPINLRIEDVVDNFPEFKTRLYLGGPVGTDTMQFIHTLGDKIRGSIRLTEHLFWGGDFDTLQLLISTQQIDNSQVRFFLGYAGWSYDQLMQEIAENSWIITDAKNKYIFGEKEDTVWQRIMNDLGGVYRQMAKYPENPELN
jgi:putative transcriptional regulator